MASNQSVCLRKLSDTRAEERMMGRFFDNKNVTIDRIKSDITEQISDLCEGLHVLSIQDTTEINHFTHRNRVKGLGPVGNPKNIGFFIHPHLVVDAAHETCLGIAAIHTYIREPKTATSIKAEPIENKESYRWIESAEVAKKHLQKAQMVTEIADRESDIYEEFARLPDEKMHLITRSQHNRCLSNKQTLFDYLNNIEAQGVYSFEVNQTKKRNKRQAQMHVKYAGITISKPSSCTDQKAPNQIGLHVVEVREDTSTVPEEEEAIHWRLLTTHKVETMEQALQIVKWYQSRWHIEQLFRVAKKQGLDVESSQLESADKLIKLTCMALQVAMQTMQLTLARKGKDQSIAAVFNGSEQKVLKEILPTLEGKTEKQKNPHDATKLSWAAWIIARLGGWKGYASESPPGPITMRNGLERFKSIYAGFLMGLKVVCID